MPFKFNFSNKTEIVEFKSITGFSTQGTWMPDFIVYENYFYFNNNQVKDEFHLPLDYIKSWASNHFENSEYQQLTEITQDLFHKAEPVFRELISELFLEVKNLPAKTVYSISDFNKELGQLAKEDFANIDEDDVQEDEIEIEPKVWDNPIKPVGLKITLKNAYSSGFVKFDLFNMQHRVVDRLDIFSDESYQTMGFHNEKPGEVVQINEYIYDCLENNDHLGLVKKNSIRIGNDKLFQDLNSGRFIFNKMTANVIDITAKELDPKDYPPHKLPMDLNIVLFLDGGSEHFTFTSNINYYVDIDLKHKTGWVELQVPGRCLVELFLYFDESKNH